VQEVSDTALCIVYLVFNTSIGGLDALLVAKLNPTKAGNWQKIPFIFYRSNPRNQTVLKNQIK
jgi:hypothetical protein